MKKMLKTQPLILAMSDINMGVASNFGMFSGDQEMKKRGRPRKYGSDGGQNVFGIVLSWVDYPGEEKNRGRPKGAGRKQILASLGEWMNSWQDRLLHHISFILEPERILHQNYYFLHNRQQELYASCLQKAQFLL